MIEFNLETDSTNYLYDREYGHGYYPDPRAGGHHLDGSYLDLDHGVDGRHDSYEGYMSESYHHEAPLRHEVYEARHHNDRYYGDVAYEYDPTLYHDGAAEYYDHGGSEWYDHGRDYRYHELDRYGHGDEHGRHYYSQNDLFDNELMENGKKKKKAKNGKKKKHKDDYDPHEVIVHFQNELDTPEKYLS